MGLGERLASFIANPPAPTRLLGGASPTASGPAIAQKSAVTVAPYATAMRMQVVTSNQLSRRSTALLRNFADRSEALRTAINWRKQQISQSEWRVVHVDPKKPPNPQVVAAVGNLFRFVNPTRKSLRSLLDQIVEDVLVLDAGCIEKEKTLGGKLLALWPVDGGTISPDPKWELAVNRGGMGCDPKATRYRQILDGRIEAELRNDQLLYIMQNESTHRVLGWSPVETLVNIIEAELYGEKYDYDMLKQSAPAGLLHMGAGLSPEQVGAFQDYYNTEIAGTKDLAIWGGGEPGDGPKYTRFGFTPEEMQREQYKSWLISKIAFVFQIDKTIFGLVDDVNRSTSKTMSARTDQGFVALARLVSEYFTREIVWEIDENHKFEFTDLLVIDQLTQAKIDQIYSQIGKTFPNELRARDGEDPVAWGDEPYNSASTATPDPLDGDEDEPNDPDPDKDPEPGDDDKPDGGEKTGGSKGARPFVKTTRRTRSAKGGYLGS